MTFAGIGENSSHLLLSNILTSFSNFTGAVGQFFKILSDLKVYNTPRQDSSMVFKAQVESKFSQILKEATCLHSSSFLLA